MTRDAAFRFCGANCRAPDGVTFTTCTRPYGHIGQHTAWPVDEAPSAEERLIDAPHPFVVGGTRSLCAVCGRARDARLHFVGQTEP